jgi:DNA helicase II / ATP-dependent DNA helicase PcrA
VHTAESQHQASDGVQGGGSPPGTGSRPGPAGPDAVLAALDPEQRAVALAARGPVCVLAGAGTGKTRAIAHRIAYLAATGVADPARVLAVTFTTRAAGELRGRLRQLAELVPDAGLGRVQARTFHAAALRQLTHFWPSTVGGPAPRVLESKIGLLAEAARRMRMPAGLTELRDAAAEIEWAKVTQVRPDDFELAAAKAGRTCPLEPGQLARLYAGYESLRTERQLVDFESVLELTAAVLSEHQAAARAVHDRYRHFVVDEYQDVNPLQKLLLEMWLGGRDDVCVVGDPRQTIYSFTGATPGYLLGFPAEYRAASVIRLVRNYRSTPQVVALANQLVAGAPRRGTPWSAAQGGPAGRDDGAAPLVAQRPGGPPPQLTEYPDEPAEAAAVARQVGALIKAGTPAGQIAILVRTNAQTQGHEEALAQAGLPFQVRGAERFFDRAEVRQGVALLRAAARSASAADDPGAQVRPILAGIGLTPQPPGGRGTARERWESLEALAQLAGDFLAASPDATLADLASELAVRSAIGHAPTLAGVTLASLHAAKGLEWDAVFLPGLTDGTVPIIYAQTEEAIEEERRLLYVGVTRARERVYLSWALARSAGGRRTRKPSRFLDGLLAGRPGAAQPAKGRGKAGDGGRRQPAGTEGVAEHDEPLFASLRAWRLATAQDQSVPAYVVFSDATLRAIAARRPASLAELAGVPGVGAVKLDRYGAAVLELCAQAGPAPGPEDAAREGGELMRREGPAR